MNNDEFIFPACENIEKKEDKKIWYWGECIKDATLAGCKMGSVEFWVVYKIRVYETHGDYKFCVAGAERLAQDIGCGVTPRQVEIALMEACQKGRLFHIWSDKRVYRNKTKIFVTKQWLEERGLTTEQIKVLSYGRSNTHKLTGKIGENGEIIDAKIVENESETKVGTSETKVGTLETKGETLETKGETLESPHMNKCNNVCKGISENEFIVSKETKQKLRVVDEDGKVCGGHPLTEKAYELWKEIMGQPCKRDKWNGQAGWNMMRAKNKGEEWLRGMLIIARECKKDPKADFRASRVADLASLQKNQDFVLDWYRNEKLKKETDSDKALDYLWEIQ